ncbi:hypothetical protein M5X00_26400 [Paenibacillus alvei]|uniref:hypothetical protein n=1 Tax=Paenibacillus alvei TaxID=44250 RepID=UPI000288E13A|nr:hypothetical protein [Paenibacillus alvei]EJW14067.1 hypothetical protein PAV_141p01730 [Paenibacillus alvei DSM 29]MCY9544882.1 hypothetical protein [Paenibacillus alvei]MCY9707782.1 hypothetical protein [Paenibacillus alvei]MCY9757764.1 hypothetical protein [Paenibacillus alvei]MEC0082705.1 hypothetical protein [Paenibacillus alvei]
MSKEDDLYKQAMKRIAELVDEVLQTCDDVADENHYEREWVLEQFRSQFNKSKRNRTQ